jgi:hypothetical protein
MQEQHPCYYPGEFAPPTKMHLNAMHWLLNRPEVSHVHVVIGKDNGPIGQNQKAKLWELLMKSSFSPQATVIKSKDKGPLSEIYSIFNEKRDKPGYIALDEKAARHKKLQEKFDQFPNYGMQLIPSQFSKSSAKMHKAVLEGDFETVKAELPPDFSDVQIEEYMSILKQPASDSPLDDKPHIINYKEQYTKKFDDGFWKSVFEPLKEDNL